MDHNHAQEVQQRPDCNVHARRAAEILTAACGGDLAADPPEGALSTRYRWASLASLENGDTEKAQVYAALAQSASVTEIGFSIAELTRAVGPLE